MPDIDNAKMDQDAMLELMGQSPVKASKQPTQDAYTSALGASAPPVAPKPTANTMPVAEAPAPSVAPPSSPQYAPSVFQGFTPKHAMEGFDFNREQNTGKSAKDAFAYLANQAPPPPLNDKAALEAWTNQYIVPGMTALGHNVSNVQGDKFHLQNWQGDFDVDYGRGAGADGGALAWQVDDGSAQMANGPYVPKASGIAPLTMPQSEGGDALAKIQAEIEALQNGQASPIDQDALASLLV